MAMFGSNVIGNDLLDIGTRKWNEEQGNDDNFRPDIMGAPTSFMVPAVANVSVLFKRIKFFMACVFGVILALLTIPFFSYACALPRDNPIIL